MFGLFSDGPSFLTETKLQGAINDLVEKAETTLTIVSPYVDPGDVFVRELERKARTFAEHFKDDEDAGISLLFRADKLSEYQRSEWFSRLDAPGVFIGVVDRLHSKIYLNDFNPLVTSLNFTYGSWVNSYDVGILVPASSSMREDIEAYLDKLGQDVRPVNGSGRRVSSSRRFSGRSRSNASREEQPDAAKGYCIGCGRQHAFDLSKPMHYECWQAKQSPKFCH